MKLSKLLLLMTALLCSTQTYAKQAIPASKLFKQPDISSIQLSSKGTYVATFENKEKGHVLRVRDIKKKIAHELSFIFAAKSKIKSFQWIDDNSVYIDYVLDGNHEEAFVHVSEQNKKLVLSTNKIKANGYIVNPLINDDNFVLFAKETNKRYTKYELYRIGVKQLELNEFSSEFEYEHQLDEVKKYISYGSSANLLLGVIVDDDEVEVWGLDEDNEDWIKYYDAEGKDYEFKPIGLIGKNTLAVLSDYNSDLMSLYEYDILKKSFGKIIFQHPKYDLTSAVINHEKEKVEFVQFYDHGRLVNHYLTSEGDKLQKRLSKSFPDKQVYILSNYDSSDHLVVLVDASDDPGTLYLFDKTSSKLKKIAEIFKELSDYNLAKSVESSVKNENGDIIETIFTQALNPNGVLLVMPHGGPIGVRDISDFNREVQYFASRGFSILKVNFRGSSGYGKKFKESGVGEFGKNIEKDISLAVNELLKSKKFQNICAIGASYGGYSSVMLAMESPELYDCVVATYGVYDLPYEFYSSNMMREDSWKKPITGVLGEMRESLYEVSPLYMAEKLTAPTLLVAGKKDDIADFEQTNRFKYRLKQLNADIETVFYNEAGHGHGHWFGEKNELAFITDFLERRLKLSKNHYTNYAEVKGEEYQSIADGFDNKYYFEPSSEKAYEHYSLASQLGTPRSQFNKGSYYHRGEIVEFSLDKAAEFYKNSSSNGYDVASLRLGQLHFNGDLKDSNLQKAQSYFKKANAQGSDTAYLYLAALNCLEIADKRNVNECVDILKLNDEKNNVKFIEYKTERSARNTLLNKIVWQEEFTLKEREKFKSTLKEVFSVDEFSPKAEIASSGSYKGYKILDKASVLKVRKNDSIGVSIVFDSEQSFESEATAMVKVRWIRDKFLDKNNRHRSNYQYLAQPILDKVKRFTYKLEEDWELAERDWTLEIRTLDNELIFMKTFHIEKIEDTVDN